MAVAGATSPVTLAGTVVQGLAEFLGVATVLQVAAPDARLIFCFGSAVLDMRQTTFAMGSVEAALMAAMATEVGHHIGVPVLCPGFSTDARHLHLQSGYEKAMKATTVCAASPDIVTGWGLLDSHNTMSLPQSVIDNEMAGMLRRLNGPVEVSEATLGGAAIATAGPGRRLPRPEGHGEAHPRRRALPADAVEPALVRQVGGAGHDRVRRGLRARGGPPRGPRARGALHRRRDSWMNSRRSAAWTRRRAAGTPRLNERTGRGLSRPHGGGRT